jgi:probable F420-dependent oxidoreductase
VQLVAGGRFVLGLGSQVRPHIERRFSMSWSQPAKRMEEYIRATRAIWKSWATGDRLDFRGEFYQHTLMTPFFDPGPNPFGTPPIWLAAVGEKMTEVAGSAADGLLGHSFTTRQYLEQVSLPALRRGRASAGRSLEELQVSVPVLVAIGQDQSALDQAILATRKQIAFYGSTPAYRSVLELHGWGDLGDRLNVASRRGEWDAMALEIDDEVLAAFAVVGNAAEVAVGLLERFGGIATRLTLNAPYDLDGEALDAVLAGLTIKKPAE